MLPAHHFRNDRYLRIVYDLVDILGFLFFRYIYRIGKCKRLFDRKAHTVLVFDILLFLFDELIDTAAYRTHSQNRYFYVFHSRNSFSGKLLSSFSYKSYSNRSA